MIEKKFYDNQIVKYKILRDRIQKKVLILAALRLLVFIAVAISWYFLFGTSAVWIITVCGLIVFLYLVSKSADVSYERKRAEKIILINEREIAAKKGDHSSFRDGSDFKNQEHPFSLDMDLFGPGSLFQLINRTVSLKGEHLLADYLSKGNQNKELSKASIIEFSGNIDWCQQFMAEGMVFLENEQEQNLTDINRIGKHLSRFRKLMIYVIPVISISSTLLFAFDIINVALFTLILFTVLSYIGSSLKLTNKSCLSVLEYERLVVAYLHQVELLDQLKINSAEIEDWREKNFGKRGEIVEVLKQLERIQKRMSFRMNLFVGLLLNFFMAWDFGVLKEWEDWKKNNGDKLQVLEKRLSELEVWISGAIYYVNHKNMCFPEFVENNSISIEKIGHPFIKEEIQVRNDISFTEKDNILIITGPNMAGKSTYLRSIGWAIISANSGLPVMAEKCSLPNLQLFTSMRNTDDLSGSSSYFHAELMRLRFIMDAIEKGDKVFVILDEILKGTNSKDKEQGSAGFLKKLNRLNTRGIIATHDLSLCKLADEDSKFRNMYFDSTIENEELSFDYKIRDGICKNMNASFLLKKMNLVDNS